jgi:drug/metabolite transporter (DMT)-like permease
MRLLERAPPSALLIVACAFWGAGTVLNKALLASLSPVSLLFLQLAPSAGVLWLATFLSGARLPKASAFAPIAALGVLNPGFAYTLSLIGLSRVSASVTTLLWASEPLMILLLATVFLREPVSLRLVAVMAIGAAGVALVAELPHGFQTAGNEPIAVFLLLTAVLCCAFYTVFSRGLSGSADPLPIVAIQQTAGLGWTAALLSARTDFGDWSDIANVALPQLATASLSGLMYYAAAYWLYLAALRFVPAAVGGAYFNVIPVFGVGLALAFLGETLTTIQWAGVAAIMASVTGLARLTR